jgi:hypothetical protein
MAVVAVAAITCALAAPFAQQPGISAVIRTEVVRVSPAPPAAAAKNADGSPNVAGMMAQMGDLFAKMMAPEGKIDMVWMARPGAARTELRNPMLMVPSGSVLITKGSTVAVLNPVERTYYEMPAPRLQVPGAPAGADAPKPEVTVTPTGKTDRLLGHPVERVDISVRMPMPGRRRDAMPAGAPTDITMTMESWETADFGTAVDPALMASFQGLMASAGIDKIVRPGRFPMKFIGRMSIMPGYEIRTTVLEVTQKALAADLFEVPSGFKKVDRPRARF